MKTQVSLIALISVMVSLAQPAWSMEEQLDPQDAGYHGQKQPEKKKEEGDEQLGSDKSEPSFDALSEYPLLYMEKRKSKFRKVPGLEKVWENLDLIDMAKKGILTETDEDHFIHLVAMGFFPKEILKDIDFDELLMSHPPEEWSDERIITAVLKLPYTTESVSDYCTNRKHTFEVLGHESYPKLVKKIQARADMGDAQALFILGLMHKRGWGVTIKEGFSQGGEMTFTEWCKEIGGRRSAHFSSMQDEEIAFLEWQNERRNFPTGMKRPPATNFSEWFKKVLWIASDEASKIDEMTSSYDRTTSKQKAMDYFTLAAEQMHPMALYQILKRYNIIAGQLEFVNSELTKEMDEYYIEEYEEDKEKLIAKLKELEESYTKTRNKVTEGIEKGLFDPMTKAHLLSFVDEEHQAQSAALGDFRALLRLGKSETINPGHALYYMLGHKAGFKKSTQKLAEIYRVGFEGPSRTLAEKKERFKKAIKFASKVCAVDHFGDTSGSDCFLHNHFSHHPLESQETKVQSSPTESVSPLESFAELIAYVEFLKGVNASTYKDSIQNKCSENSAGIVLDILNKYDVFFEKLNHIPGLLFPGEFHYHYDPRTGRNIEPLAFALNEMSGGRVSSKTDSIYYTINGEKYTSMVWKKYLNLLEPTVLDANQKVMQKEFNKLLKYTQKALALLNNEKVDLSQALLTLSLTSESNVHDRSFYSYFSPYLGENFNELNTEEKEKRRARAIEAIEARRANLEHHINLINNFAPHIFNSIEHMRGQLQKLFMNAFDFYNS